LIQKSNVIQSVGMCEERKVFEAKRVFIGFSNYFVAEFFCSAEWRLDFLSKVFVVLIFCFFCIKTKENT
jgi:hypothetical protein